MFDPGSVPMLATHESRDIALDPLEPVDLTHPPGARPMLYNNTLIWSIIKGIISQGLNVTGSGRGLVVMVLDSGL